MFQELENLPKGYTVPENRVKPWGTAHAILCAKDKVKENFAIINSDDFYGRDAYRVIANFLKNNKDESKYAMAGYHAENTLTENGAVKRGVCQIKDNYLTELIESEISTEGDKLKAKALETGEEFYIEPSAPVSMNMFAFTPKLFDYLEERFVNFLDKNKDDLEKCEYLIPTVIYDLINEGKVSVEVLDTTAVWQGITYREDKEALVNGIDKLTKEGLYPDNLWEEK